MLQQAKQGLALYRAAASSQTKEGPAVRKALPGVGGVKATQGRQVRVGGVAGAPSIQKARVYSVNE